MPVGERRGHTAPDGALHEPLLNEVGFDDVFERFAVFTQGACEVVDAAGAACEFLHDGRHETAVDGVKSDDVHIQKFQRRLCDFGGDLTDMPHLGYVAHASQPAFGESWSSAGAAGDFVGTGFVNGDV